MKEKLTRNTGLKILSLLLAVLLWVVILNEDNPVKTEVFKDIKVTVINEQSLQEKDKVYEVVKGKTIDVKVKGKRKIVDSLTPSNFKAVADLSLLSINYVASIDVTVPGFSNDIEILDTGNYILKVSLENKETEQFRVEVVENGMVADGNYIYEKKATPNIMQVSGAESVINTIAEVVVEVDVTNASESFKVTEVPKVYDKNGSIIDSSKLQLNYDAVDVSVNLLKTKTVPFVIDVTGEPFYGYEYVSAEYEPKQITIAGEKEVLDKITYIKGEYNVKYKREDFQGEVNIEDFIKEDVILIDDNKTAVIHVKVEKLESKDISFSLDDINVINVPEGLKAEFEGENEFEVRVYGNKDALNKINRYNINPFIDLSNYQLGTDYVKIQFNIQDDSVDYSYPSISVTLVENNVG